MSDQLDKQATDAVQRAAAEWFRLDAVLYFSGLPYPHRAFVMSHLRKENSESGHCWASLSKTHILAMDVGERRAQQVMADLVDRGVIQVIKDLPNQPKETRIAPTWLDGVVLAYENFLAQKKTPRLPAPTPKKISPRSPVHPEADCTPKPASPLPRNPLRGTPKPDSGDPSIILRKDPPTPGGTRGDPSRKRRVRIPESPAVAAVPPSGPPADKLQVQPVSARVGSDVASETFRVALPPAGYPHPFWLTEQDKIVLAPGVEAAKVWRELLEEYPEAVLQEALIAAAPDALRGVRNLAQRHNKGRELLAIVRKWAQVKLKYHKQEKRNGARADAGSAFVGRFK